MCKFERNVNRIYTLGGVILLIIVIMAMSSCSSSTHCVGSEWVVNERPVTDCENCDEIDQNMKIEKELIIISGFMGFAIGVCSMMFVNVDKEVKQVKETESVKFKTEIIIVENINTCEDIIEWMNEDVKNYADSTVFDTYIWNLENIINENYTLLQTEYDY